MRELREQREQSERREQRREAAERDRKASNHALDQARLASKHSWQRCETLLNCLGCELLHSVYFDEKLRKLYAYTYTYEVIVCWPERARESR